MTIVKLTAKDVKYVTMNNMLKLKLKLLKLKLLKLKLLKLRFLLKLINLMDLLKEVINLKVINLKDLLKVKVKDLDLALNNAL